MNMFTRVLTMLSLAVVCGQAVALPKLRKVTPSFTANSNGNLRAGLTVEASTDLLVLVIGGGFTLTCNTSTLRQTAQRLKTYSSNLGPHETLQIPDVVPSVYPIPGWASVPEETCGAECAMEYTAEARDESSLSIRVGSAGVGAGFTLIPQGTQSEGNTILSNICRTSRPRCCTPLCSIP
jgi:hypothetical protein